MFYLTTFPNSSAKRKGECDIGVRKHYIYHCLYDKGSYYERNQDSLLFQTFITKQGPMAIACVCDGVGGLRDGEYASGFVVKELAVWMEEKGIPLLINQKGKRALKNSLLREMAMLHEALKKHGAVQGKELGTTVSILILYSNHYFIYHVGDSRIVRLNTHLKAITRDEKNHKGELLQAIGFQSLPKPQIKFGSCSKKDAFLLCTDGFYKNLSDSVLEGLFCLPKGQYVLLDKRLEESLHKIRQNGERDNITALYVRRLT